MITAPPRRIAATAAASAVVTGFIAGSAPATAQPFLAAGPEAADAVTATGSSETSYPAPGLEDVSAETMHTVRLADGEGSQVIPGTERYVQIESPAHFEAAPYDEGQSLDLWLIPPEGEDAGFFGTFEVQSDEDPDQYWSRLGPVTFPPEAFDYSGVYAAALADQQTGEVLAWQRTVVELDGDQLTEDSPGGSTTETWPVPQGDQPQPTTEAPSLMDLSGEGYGQVFIDEDSPVIPLDRPFTAIIPDTTQPADYWLLPPDGSDAIWLPMEAIPSQNYGQVFAELTLAGEDVDFTGIYGLVAKSLSGSVVGWTPFGISAEGESIQPGDPGVNEDDTNTDRSIFPIPDSVPVPTSEADDDDVDETGPAQQTGSTEQTAPEDSSAESGDPADQSSAADGDQSSQTSEAAAGGDQSENHNLEAASGTSSTAVWAAALAGTGGVLLIAGLVYLVTTRRRAGS